MQFSNIYSLKIPKNRVSERKKRNITLISKFLFTLSYVLIYSCKYIFQRYLPTHVLYSMFLKLLEKIIIRQRCIDFPFLFLFFVVGIIRIMYSSEILLDRIDFTYTLCYVYLSIPSDVSDQNVLHFDYLSHIQISIEIIQNILAYSFLSLLN